MPESQCPPAAASPWCWIVEHPKEKKQKCTVAILRGREGLRFVDSREIGGRDWGNALLLHVEGERVLDAGDAGRPLILIDASWRWAERVARKLVAERRRLPEFQTSYPRASQVYRDPPGGLASAEALFVATLCLGGYDETFLEEYRWKREFLEANRGAIAALRKAPGGEKA
jgi:pre-rRNA-processing protein TSR3